MTNEHHHIFCLYYPPTSKAKELYDGFKKTQDVILLNAGSLKDSTDPWMKDNVVQESELAFNISHKNPSFCELTAFWAVWKNYIPKWNDDDWIEFSHYRKTLNLPSDFKEKDVVYVSLPYPMRFYINHVLTPCSIQTGTLVCHPKPSWEALETTVKDLGGWRECSEFDEWKSLSSMPAPINIWAMKVKHFKTYCSWLFERVCAIDTKIPYDNEEYRTAYQMRALSYMGERLFSFWAWSRDMRGDIEMFPVSWTLHDGFKTAYSDQEERRMTPEQARKRFEESLHTKSNVV